MQAGWVVVVVFVTPGKRLTKSSVFDMTDSHQRQSYGCRPVMTLGWEPHTTDLGGGKVRAVSLSVMTLGREPARRDAPRRRRLRSARHQVDTRARRRC